MTRKVLIPDAVAPVCDRVFVDAGYQVNRMITPTPNEIAASIADYDAIVVRSAVEVTAELIARGTRLRAIGRAGAGVDNIDVDAATTAGVTVINTPGGNTVSAAEHTIALLMALLRKIPAADHSMKQGAWNRSSFKGNEICGKRIGIVGLGRIGRAVAVRLGAFEAEIIGFDPMMTADQMREAGAEPASYESLLASCDIVSFHLPLTDKTRSMLDAASIGTMPKGAIVLNVSRGGVVDESALLAALESGHIAGAGIDVWEHEPPIERSLSEHPHVVATPHIAASTREAQERVAIGVASSIIAHLAGEEIEGVVNPAVLRPS